MKLKLVVATMSVLGLVSSPLFAADSDTQTTTETTQTTTQTQTTKHAPKHKKSHRKMVKRQPQKVVETTDYREVAPMPCQPAQVVCTIPEAAVTMEAMTQNVGRALPNPCNPGWFNRIAISGGINVDLGKWGDRSANYMGENYQRLSLNDAYLNIFANVNDWAKAFASISYNTATINDPLTATATSHVAEYDAAYDDNAISGGRHNLQLEQAFITIGNFDASPIFLQFGKAFQDFGRYEIHPITESMTQVMSKTLATSANIGFIAGGFHGQAYVFDNPIPKVNGTHRPTTWGVSLGFDQATDCNQIGWGLGVAYLSNLIGVNDIAYAVNQYNLLYSTGYGAGYHTRAGGLAAYFDLSAGPFYMGLRYVTALQRFNRLDLPRYGTADITLVGNGPYGTLNADASGAKPWSAGINLGVGFCNFFDRSQTIYVGYQQSGQASGLLLPKNRWLIGYGIDLWKNTDFSVEWDHDIAYSVASGGTGNNTNLVSLRAAVKFS